MYILIQIALLALCCSMFKLSREYKVAVLLLASICFESVILERVPFGQAKYVLSHCFILSELPYIAKHIRSLKRTVLYSLMSIAIVAAVILLVNSPHFNNNLKDILRLFILELTGKYFVLCYAFVSIISMGSMRPVLKVSYYGLLVLTLFGLMNLLTRRALFIDAIGSHMNVAENLQDLGATFMYSDRFRVQAMFFNPFNYGYICCLLMFLQLWGYLKGMVARRRFLICMACCMLGILSCGCRTIIFCWLIGILTFIYYSFPVKKWFKYIVIGVFVGIMAYSAIPAVQDKVNQTMTIFDSESRNVGGSSIEMRLLQYATLLYYIKGHELFGRGYGYFNIDLG